MSSETQETTGNSSTESQSGAEAGQLGFSNSESVRKIFTASPIHKGTITPELTENVYFRGGNYAGDIKIDGLSGQVTNGLGFSETVNLNYAGAPDGTIAASVVGAPANAYVPNPTSPGGTIGVPTDNPNSKGEAPKSFVEMDGFGGTTGGGPSMLDSNGKPITPQNTSEKISDSQKSPGSLGESAWTKGEKINSQTPVQPQVL